MQVECGHCKKRYNIADENAGKQFACRACGQRSPVVPLGAAGTATAAAVQTAARPAAASTAVATKATISVACPKCGKQYQNVPASAVGKPFKCKACQQISPIQAAPARASGAATVRKDAAAAKPGAPARTAAKPAAAKPAAAKAAAVSAAPAMAGAASASPLAPDPLGPSDPLGQDVFGGSANLLDLLGDAPLPGSTGTPLTSSPLLAKPLTAEPPKNVKAKKKKKKKSGDSAMSDHVTVMLRMMGGGFLALCGLGLIIWGIVIISNPDDERWSPGRAIRCFVGGVSLIGGGLKAIVG